MNCPRLLAFLVAVPTLAAPAASAQSISAAWQMQPYCNRLALALTPSPAGGLSLQGVDDQCGAVNQGSVVGQASFNGVGNVTLNFTIVTAPSARAVHVSAIASPATGNGTWTDSVGNAGTFAFFGSVPGLPPRPLPASGLPPGSIGAADLASGAIGQAQLAAGAVTGAKVADRSLTSIDLADGPRAAFVNVLSASVSTTPQVLATVTLTAPAAGTVVVNATTYAIIFQSANAATFVQCAVTRGTTLEAEGLTVIGANPSGVTTRPYLPAALTRGFDVWGGVVSVNLVCDRTGGGSIALGPINMTATYFPRP